MNPNIIDSLLIAVIFILIVLLVSQAYLSRQMQRALRESNASLKEQLSRERDTVASSLHQERARIEAELRQQHDQDVHMLKEQHAQAIELARKDSVGRSRSTLKGQISEQLAPLLPGFPYHSSEVRFLGHPIDYIVFNGYTGIKDRGESTENVEVVLVDIKTGKSVLSPSQLAVAKAVQAGRVRFEVIRILEDGTVKCYAWGSHGVTSV